MLTREDHGNHSAGNGRTELIRGAENHLMSFVGEATKNPIHSDSTVWVWVRWTMACQSWGTWLWYCSIRSMKGRSASSRVNWCWSFGQGCKVVPSRIYSSLRLMSLQWASAQPPSWWNGWSTKGVCWTPLVRCLGDWLQWEGSVDATIG